MEAVNIRTLIGIAAICFVVLGCRNDTAISVPSFQLKVNLSEEAAKKLSESGEIIEGNVFFDGDGIHKKGEDTAPFRAVFLGQYHFEMKTAGAVDVKDAKISQEAFNRLSDRNYYYTVNVFSGRRVFKNNILDFGYAGGRISEAVSSPIEINCNLAPSGHTR